MENWNGKLVKKLKTIVYLIILFNLDNLELELKKAIVFLHLWQLFKHLFMVKKKDILHLENVLGYNHFQMIS